MTQQFSDASSLERLVEIRQRADDATKGPWEVAPRSSDDEIANVVAEYQAVQGGARAHWIAELDAAIDFYSDRDGQIEQMTNDALFIAHARADIPFLLEQLAEAIKAREAAEQKRDDYWSDLCEATAGKGLVHQALYNEAMARAGRAEAEAARLRASNVELRDLLNKYGHDVG